MIIGKATKPRTLLMLDAALLVVVAVHLIAALTVNVFAGPDTRGYLMAHRILGLTGITLAALVGTHLALHLAWIRAQVQRAVGHNASRHGDHH